MKILALCLLLSFSAFAQSANKPKIRPYFDRVDDGPAFMIECENPGDVSVSSADSRWATMNDNNISIDGISPEFGYSLGPGLSREVNAGETWRGILALRQSPNNFFPAVNNGALKRLAMSYPLTAGQHTLAVKCFGVWSDKFTFYWEPNPRKNSER